MITHARARGTSLAVRLLALVVIPLVALAFLASVRIQNERDAVDDAIQLAETVELQQAVASVYPLAQVEQIALEGLAVIDGLALPREIVVAFSGLDLEGMAEDNHAELDRSLDGLAERFGGVVLGSGERLDAKLRDIRVAIDVERDRSKRRIGRSDEVTRIFEEFDDVLADVIAQHRVTHSPNVNPDGPRIQLDLLAEVVLSAGEHAELQLRTLLYQTDEFRFTAQRLGATHKTWLDAFSGTLDTRQRAELRSLHMLASELPTTSPSSQSLATDDTAILDPALIADAADVAIAHLDYITRIADYSSDFHETTMAQADEHAAAARSDVRRTAWLLVAIALVTTILISYVFWSTIAPIRKLTRRAESISQGDLDHADLGVSGPRDLRALITTTNEMVATLNQMQHEVGRLASGHVTTDTTPALPGAIGVSMRESVVRLATVTAQLKNSEQFASAIVAEAADAIWTVDADGRIRSANAASEELSGRHVDDQIGCRLSSFLSATRGEATVASSDGPAVPVLAVDSVVDVGDERVTIVIAHDISERARYEARLAYQANHDALTDLPNRFSLLAQLDRRLASGDRVAVLFVDLDGFKNINDTKGHAVGDEVLTAVAERLRGCVGPDGLIGRLGGDEFVILTPLLPDVDEIIAFGEWVIRSIERPHHIGGETFSLSASTGIALPQPGANALDALRQADNAVYQAKRRGRGRVEFFDAEMQARIEHEAELELALRQAVRSGQLSIDLQPVLDLQTGKIVCAEALARWTRPGIGPVPPTEFIPIAERSSLIFEVERWVLRRVCEQLVDWRGRDPHCSARIAVNISGRHLIDGNLIADVDEALLITGADPTMLELELTESQLLEDHERATEVLEALRALGITIAVDDFGTGYSSLTYLRHLPVDAVKIDRSFVARVTENGHDSTIIEALLTISRSLDLTVVAEGVETSGQLDYLKAHGCDRAQGFLIARPVPAAAAESMILDLDDAVV